MATKLWITSAGKVILSNNNSKIPNKILRKLIRMIEANSADIIDEWIIPRILHFAQGVFFIPFFRKDDFHGKSWHTKTREDLAVLFSTGQCGWDKKMENRQRIPNKGRDSGSDKAKNCTLISEEWDFHSLRHTHATILYEAGVPSTHFYFMCT